MFMVMSLLEQLATELLLEVVRYVSGLEDVLSLRLVNQRWRELLGNCVLVVMLQRLMGAECVEVSDAVVAFLSRRCDGK